MARLGVDSEKMMRRMLIGFLSCGLLGLGCGGKGESGAAGGAAGAGGGAAPSAPAEATGPHELKLSNGITVTVPGDGKESAMGKLLTVGAHNGKCQAMINEANDMSPSFENELQNIDAGHKGGPLKEYKRKDKTGPNDFVIEWTTDKKFGFSMRKTINGKVWSCYRVSQDAESQACVVAICESMK